MTKIKKIIAACIMFSTLVCGRCYADLVVPQGIESAEGMSLPEVLLPILLVGAGVVVIAIVAIAFLIIYTNNNKR